MRRRVWLDSDPDIEAAQAEWVTGGLLAPLALGGDEQQLWLDCDLASLAENRLGDVTDPRALDEDRRARWLTRALTETPWPPSARDHECCYWIVHGGERAGTIAVAKSALGSRFVRISSLYLYATHRGGGTARAVLEKVQETLGGRGLGVRLETSWTWQRAVRFYLRIGMWVHAWKHDLVFSWPADAARPLIEVDQDRARLSVRRAPPHDEIPLMAAERVGNRLRLDEVSCPSGLEHLRLDAMSTLGVSLAMHGWPLVRSKELWDQCQGSDLGFPESLAYKIVIWEAWSRKHGWCVETPSIPGLEYQTWDELESRWQAQAEASGRLAHR